MSDKSKFKISLQENGEHSLKKSLESYREYDRTKDQFLLKDTIMFLHHGIELLMKELLVRHSPYLIFEDLKDLPKKQKDADKKGVSIFNIERPPKSVSYEIAISRVDAFLNYPEFDDDLNEKLAKLNGFRNQLEHYAIEVEREKVVELLETIHEPIIRLFETYLGPMPQLQTPQVRQTWEIINNDARDIRQANQQANQRVAALMRKFDGQIVPGYLFGTSGQITLPKFDQILIDALVELKFDGRKSRKAEIDVLGKITDPISSNSKIRWIVETKISKSPSSFVHAGVGYQLQAIGKELNASSWLVVFNRAAADLRALANPDGLLITDLKELEILEKLVN